MLLLRKYDVPELTTLSQCREPIESTTLGSFTDCYQLLTDLASISVSKNNSNHFVYMAFFSASHNLPGKMPKCTCDPEWTFGLWSVSVAWSPAGVKDGFQIQILGPGCYMSPERVKAPGVLGCKAITNLITRMIKIIRKGYIYLNSKMFL